MTLDIFYFNFETDFIEDNIRCIPMIVRFKLDIVRIKLKLSEWVKFSGAERLALAQMPCETEREIAAYHHFLSSIIVSHTKQEATFLIDEKLDFTWKNLDQIPLPIKESAMSHQCEISMGQWRQLPDIQRFALVKLSTSSHESHNFINAIREFGIIKSDN
jgi:hypothetical protein